MVTWLVDLVVEDCLVRTRLGGRLVLRPVPFACSFPLWFLGVVVVVKKLCCGWERFGYDDTRCCCWVVVGFFVRGDFVQIRRMMGIHCPKHTKVEVPSFRLVAIHLMRIRKLVVSLGCVFVVANFVQVFLAFGDVFDVLLG